jgi:Lamin Tail Domain
MRDARRLLAMCGLCLASCAKIISADFDGVQPPQTGGSGGTGGTDPGDGGGPLDDGAAGSGGESTGGSGGGDASVDENEPGDDASDGSSSGGAAGDDASSGGGGGAGGTGGGGGGATGGSGGGDAGPDADAGTGGSAKDAEPPDADGAAVIDADTGRVVINEVNGKSIDFVELMNVGTKTFDLSGYGVTQASGTFGAPSLNDAYYFPQGTKLDPGQYLLVLPNGTSTGPSTSCNGWASSCFTVTWGITSSGEGVYLLMPDTSVLDQAAYPNAAPQGQSWGRIPNGTGTFTDTALTPNAANHIP